MSLVKLSQPVFLCGMMGAGKSTVGKFLARKLDVSFRDLDEIIQTREESTIPEIFEANGEEHFRKVEREALIKHSQEFSGVMALGGGSLQNQFIVDHLKAHGWLIFLQAPLSVLLQRLKNSKNRPMLQKKDLEERLTQLLDERTPFYRQAHITVEGGKQTHNEVVDEILKKLSVYER